MSNEELINTMEGAEDIDSLRLTCLNIIRDIFTNKSIPSDEKQRYRLQIESKYYEVKERLNNTLD